MAADQSSEKLNALLKDFMYIKCLRLHAVRLEEKSFPVVNCTFTKAKFKMNFFGDDSDDKSRTVLMKDFFRKGLDELQSGGTSPDAQQACKRLKDFLSCVPLGSALEKCEKEEDFNCLVASNVLIPLSSGKCLINKLTPVGARNKRLKVAEQTGEEGLVMGYSGGYRGELDMVVVPDYQEDLPVVISCEEQPGPTPKKAKTGRNSPGKLIVEGQNVNSYSLNSFSKCVATIITFSYIQKERHSDISYAFPMLRVNPKGVVVLVYDTHNDILLISDCLVWSEAAILVTWLVLHYSLFPPSDLSHLEVDSCCGYRTALGDTQLGDVWFLKNRSVFHGIAVKQFQCP